MLGACLSLCLVFFSSIRRHTCCALVTWSSDVCSSDLCAIGAGLGLSGLAVVSLGLVLFAGRLALSTRRSRVVSGREEMIGSIAEIGRASCRESVCQYV